MAKKMKKQTRKVSGVSSATNGYSVASSDTSAAPVLTRSGSGSDFNPDYSQTIKDLKRIGILASSFFAVLIIISFFLR